jgi:hypothetical protein
MKKSELKSIIRECMDDLREGEYSDSISKEFSDLTNSVISFKTSLKRIGDIPNSKGMSSICEKFLKDIRKEYHKLP